MSSVTTLDRRLGRRMLGKFRTGGSPLIRNTPATLHAAGINRVGRVTAVAPDPDATSAAPGAVMTWAG
jgi:hypothetical protein